ncbi:MAG: esterase-like activity of phytase family protein [Vicinamibacterales bacterium]
MPFTHFTRTVAILLFAPMPLWAQFTTPHTTSTAASATATLGATAIVNHGLVGVGRIPAGTLDSFVPSETFGSISGLQVTNWARQHDGTYTGTFHILPDRGYNSGSFYSDYAARIYQIGFAFKPYTAAAPLGGATVGAKLATQNQITWTTGISGVKFTYFDPTRNAQTLTTGLEPANGVATLFGAPMPYVRNYTGAATPDATSNTLFTDINKLALDSEALAFRADGSGYVGDEYGGHIYYFDASKQIVGVIVPPAAWIPHLPLGTPYFGATGTPLNGRRINQGIEGVALSPDGSRLFALLQSATLQDSDGSNQNRRQTRLLVYDVTGTATPASPMAEYALTLPTYRTTGNGAAVNATAAQSEIVALDTQRLLVLSRDGNGLGAVGTNPSVYKSILYVDLSVGAPTNFAGDIARDAEGGKITSAPGVLAPGVTPVSWVEVVNMLNPTQLAKFNLSLDPGTAQVDQFTLGEKWEGLALTSANDPAHPDDYFLFVGNDNDFLTSSGSILGPAGAIVAYDGFAGYPASRQPANAGGGNINANDTIFLVYRLTIVRGLGVAATAGGTALAVPIRIDYLDPTPKGGSTPTPFVVKPATNTQVSLVAPAWTTVGGQPYRFTGWQWAQMTNGSPSLTVKPNGPATATALYEAIPDTTFIFRLINARTGATLPGTLSVSQPALGPIAGQAQFIRKAFEPYTVAAPYAIGSCVFRSWAESGSGFVLGNTRTINGTTGTSGGTQTWLASYSCP